MTGDEARRFARDVKDACRRVPAAGRLGGSKVWIHAAWAVGRGDLPLDAFKAALLEVSRQGLVRLARADMPEACDPRDVRRSKLVHCGFEFNLIRD